MKQFLVSFIKRKMVNCGAENFDCSGTTKMTRHQKVRYARIYEITGRFVWTREINTTIIDCTVLGACTQHIKAK